MAKYTRVLGWVIACCFLGSAIVVPAQVLSPELPEAAPADEVVAAAKLSSTRLAPKRLTEYSIAGLEERVTGLESIDPMDVVHLIYILAGIGKINNLVIGPGVAGLTTKLKFDDVSVGEALDVVLSVNNLAFEVKNGIITIMSDAEYQRLYGQSFYDNKEVKIVTLKYADPTRVQGMLGPVKSTIGTIVADPVTGNLILIDTPAKLKEMEAVIAKADIETVSRIIPTQTETYRLQYADVADIQAQLMPMLSKEAGQLRTDSRTRTMIVTDLPYNLSRIREMVRLFDLPCKQVFIESKIVQLRLSDAYRLGVNWDHVFDGIDPRFRLSSVIQPFAVSGLAGSSLRPTGTLTYNTIAANGNLNMIIEALRDQGETKIVVNPHVTIKDGMEATIKVVTDQPYAQAQLESGTTNVLGEDIKFIEVGATLSVTPRINDQKMISMDIKPEVSSVVGEYQAFRPVPIVRRSLAETSVMIEDGQTVIIAGMIDTQKDTQQERIPILGAIPLLGMLFRSETETSQSTEMIAFITPRIITGKEPVQRLMDMKKKPRPMRSVGLGENKKLKPIR